MKKIILGLFFLIVVAVLAVVGLKNLDEFIKQSIEYAGSQTTQTSVTLQKVNVSLRSGRGELHGLQINNPDGFSTPYAFLMDQIALEIDPTSLLGDVVVIKEVKIDGAKFIAQQKNLKDVNLYELLKTVQKSLPEGSSEPEQPQTASKVRLMIEKITFENNNFRLVTEKFGEKTLNLPVINLANIGDKERGLAPNEVAKAILKPLLAQVGDAAKAQLKTLFEESGKDKIKSKVKDLIDDKLTDDQKKKVDKLKSLFGK
jgi:uncharacterized protein involved in outer membrane biogenesis